MMGFRYKKKSPVVSLTSLAHSLIPPGFCFNMLPHLTSHQTLIAIKARRHSKPEYLSETGIATVSPTPNCKKRCHLSPLAQAGNEPWPLGEPHLTRAASVSSCLAGGKQA
ncbi:hypothetical protein H9Q72_008962 [Fusarium xylarioides]|uniref:Uncharacterized protein n=1 Tax=Fusarium xylarioides TaxID=221167 RepID=A0A9P7L382_9HYPO|nr:hypothetical protein H9Q70_006144 [Fusarium xylarioides]KAG5762924.1 hypothetical protein H9Q72_008962 [Fusarium xylarioides]